MNGAVVSVRNKGDKIGMWLNDSSQGDAIISIGKKVKERLTIDARVSNGLKISCNFILFSKFSSSDNSRIRGPSGHHEEVRLHGKEQVHRVRRGPLSHHHPYRVHVYVAGRANIKKICILHIGK